MGESEKRSKYLIIKEKRIKKLNLVDKEEENGEN